MDTVSAALLIAFIGGSLICLIKTYERLKVRRFRHWAAGQLKILEERSTGDAATMAPGATESPLVASRAAPGAAPGRQEWAKPVMTVEQRLARPPLHIVYPSQPPVAEAWHERPTVKLVLELCIPGKKNIETYPTFELERIAVEGSEVRQIARLIGYDRSIRKARTIDFSAVIWGRRKGNKLPIKDLQAWLLVRTEREPEIVLPPAGAVVSVDGGWTFPVKATVAIGYVDSNGRRTDRVVALDSVQLFADRCDPDNRVELRGDRIFGLCQLRGEHREFLFERIRYGADGETGEVIDDLGAHLIAKAGLI